MIIIYFCYIELYCVPFLIACMTGLILFLVYCVPKATFTENGKVADFPYGFADHKSAAEHSGGKVDEIFF